MIKCNYTARCLICKEASDSGSSTGGSVRAERGHHHALSMPLGRTVYHYVTTHIVKPHVRGFHHDIMDRHPLTFLEIAR